jgi:hypothetical protein
VLHQTKVCCNLGTAAAMRHNLPKCKATKADVNTRSWSSARSSVNTTTRQGNVSEPARLTSNKPAQAAGNPTDAKLRP